MALTREDMLRELELLPVWQPSPAFVAKPTLVHAQEAEPAPVMLLDNDATERLLTPALSTPVVAAPSDMSPAEAPIAMQGADAADAPLRDANEVDVQDSPLVHLQEDVLDDPVISAGMTLSEGRREKIRTLGWEELQACVEHCQACGLAKTRKQTVFGVGDAQADWLFVGEAPGAEEDKRGEPFVGAAGVLLDNMLRAIQLRRGERVYIANVLKCRPPENRDPQGEEVHLCDPFLKRQVELIQPKMIVALGKFAAQSLLNTTDSIAQLRGRTHEYHGVPVVVTYHPAYLLRNLPDKAKAWEDLCRARAMMQTL